MNLRVLFHEEYTVTNKGTFLFNTRYTVLREVLTRFLGVDPIIGPAEFNVRLDHAYGGRKGFCEVLLDGVSFKPKRDFRRAAEALEKIFRGILEKDLGEGRQVQLRVVIRLDRPLPGTESNLVECEPLWVVGKAD